MTIVIVAFFATFSHDHHLQQWVALEVPGGFKRVPVEFGDSNAFSNKEVDITVSSSTEERDGFDVPDLKIHCRIKRTEAHLSNRTIKKRKPQLFTISESANYRTGFIPDTAILDVAKTCPSGR